MKNIIIKSVILDEWKKINENNSKLILVNGSRKSGRSTVLMNHDNDYNENRHIFYFDYNEALPNLEEKELETYFEVLFSLKLLDSNLESAIYGIMRKQYFNKLLELFENIKNLKDVRIDRFYYSEKIIKEIKLAFKNKQLTLIIPKFDLLVDNSESKKSIVENYFSFFDNIIISTNKNSFDEKNLSFFNIGYSKDFGFVKQILLNYLYLYNESVSKINRHTRKTKIRRIDEMLSDEIILKLIKKTDGNILYLLEIINYAKKFYMGSSDSTFEQELLRCLDLCVCDFKEEDKKNYIK